MDNKITIDNKYMEQYKSYRIVHGKARWVIVDENRDIINNDPTTNNLINLHIEKAKYKYEKNQLLDILKRYYKETGKIPRSRDFNKQIYPSPRTYSNHFGSWNNALKLAGLNTYTKQSDDILLDYIIQFYKKNKRSPTTKDFVNNSDYPSFAIYQRRFGSWHNALKLAGLDLESMVKKGFLKNTNQKARLAEIVIRDHFENKPIDLAGYKHDSPYDGICPNGKTYDVKSSKFFPLENRWQWHTNNKYKEEIEIYYLLGFSNDWNNLEHAWRIPGEEIDNDRLSIRLFDIPNMRPYEITDIIIPTLKNILEESK